MTTPVWRDDDILMYGPLDRLKRIDDLFQKYHAVHTVAVIVKSLEKNDELVRLILDRQMDAQLHGYWHDDLPQQEEGRAQLPMACDVMERLLGKRPTVLYPPWNRTSPELEKFVNEMGLQLSWRKVNLKQVIGYRGDVPEGTVCNFHYWADECSRLEEALKTCHTI